MTTLTAPALPDNSKVAAQGGTDEENAENDRQKELARTRA